MTNENTTVVEASIDQQAASTVPDHQPAQSTDMPSETVVQAEQKSVTIPNNKKNKTKPNNQADLSKKISQLKDVWSSNFIKQAALTRPAGFSKHINNSLIGKKTINPDEDGVTHINTSGVGKTKLGQLLEINAFSKFNHPDLGSFSSLGGLWYFVCGNQDDKFRSLSGRKCRLAGERQQENHIEGFKTIIAEASWIKVIQNQEIIKLMIESADIPFNSYYVQGDMKLPVFTAANEWYVPILEEIRRAIIANDKIAKEFESNGGQVDLEKLVIPDFSFVEIQQAEYDRKQKARRDRFNSKR